MRLLKPVICVSAGVLITLPAFFLAVMSAGSGHGHYEFAKVFFPYSILLTPLTGNAITLPLICLALVQFPAYGLALGLAMLKDRGRMALACIAAVHVIAAAFCFTKVISGF